MDLGVAEQVSQGHCVHCVPLSSVLTYNGEECAIGQSLLRWGMGYLPKRVRASSLAAVSSEGQVSYPRASKEESKLSMAFNFIIHDFYDLLRWHGLQSSTKKPSCSRTRDGDMNSGSNNALSWSLKQFFFPSIKQIDIRTFVCYTFIDKILPNFIAMKMSL